MCTFIETFLSALLYKTHDIHRDELILTIYSMACNMNSFIDSKDL